MLLRWAYPLDARFEPWSRKTLTALVHLPARIWESGTSSCEYHFIREILIEHVFLMELKKSIWILAWRIYKDVVIYYMNFNKEWTILMKVWYKNVGLKYNFSTTIIKVISISSSSNSCIILWYRHFLKLLSICSSIY